MFKDQQNQTLSTLSVCICGVQLRSAGLRHQSQGQMVQPRLSHGQELEHLFPQGFYDILPTWRDNYLVPQCPGGAACGCKERAQGLIEPRTIRAGAARATGTFPIPGCPHPGTAHPESSWLHLNTTSEPLRPVETEAPRKSQNPRKPPSAGALSSRWNKQGSL